MQVERSNVAFKREHDATQVFGRRNNVFSPNMDVCVNEVFKKVPTVDILHAIIKNTISNIELSIIQRQTVFLRLVGIDKPARLRFCICQSQPKNLQILRRQCCLRWETSGGPRKYL